MEESELNEVIIRDRSEQSRVHFSDDDTVSQLLIDKIIFS